MDQKGDFGCRAEPPRGPRLSVIMAAAVVLSGFNALVQLVKTLAELGGLVR